MDLEKIKESLQNEDNKALEYLYLEFGDYCIQKLIKNRNCMLAEAEDLFIESVMVIREKILREEIEHLVNTKAYLFTICENKFLARLKLQKNKNKKISEVESLYYSFSDEEDEWNSSLMEATKEAWNQLSEKCKDIISYFYIDRLRMLEIAQIMHFANANVAKTTKQRCYKKFSDVARKIYKSSKVEI
ncbi:hypothetical protein [Ekhidna sp.]|uniref:RNA polymerase sigma factor n=1 Tax=Ekhidna sp. TaxID=2608089 RepID=UPI003299EB42